MPSSAIFTLPVPVYQQTKSTRKAQYRPQKRKRHGSVNTESTQSLEPNDDKRAQSLQSSQFSEYSAVLTPDERSQYRVAGQPFDDSPPSTPFPHAPAKNNTATLNTTASVATRLAALDPPIYVDSSRLRNVPLHQQHLAVITAILHRSLSDRDYGRAGRALSLILRDELGGHTLDIRGEGRWGIGAEILLRRGAQVEHKSSHPLKESSMFSEDMAHPPVPWFTQQGFEDAKRYYERLIVQYPFHKPNAGSVSALDFYPAMFGLWIYVVQAENSDDKGSSHQDELDAEARSDRPTSSETWGSRSSSRRRILEQGHEIADQMDACMTTIPYSDSLELIRLRGMVALWLADLLDDTANDARETDASNEAGIFASEAEQARAKADAMFRKVRGSSQPS